MISSSVDLDVMQYILRYLYHQIMVMLIKHFTFDESKFYMEVLEKQFRIAIVSTEFKSIQKFL